MYIYIGTFIIYYTSLENNHNFNNNLLITLD